MLKNCWDSSAKFCVSTLDSPRIMPHCFHVWDSLGDGNGNPHTDCPANPLLKNNLPQKSRRSTAHTSFGTTLWTHHHITPPPFPPYYPDSDKQHNRHYTPTKQKRRRPQRMRTSPSALYDSRKITQSLSCDPRSSSHSPQSWAGIPSEHRH